MSLVHVAITSNQRPDEPLYAINSGYVASVHRAGALPVILSPHSHGKASCAELMERFDCLILTGGVDVHPVHFGCQPQPGIGVVCPERDAFELALARWALENGFPVLGICRGAQVLNIAAGGTLHQDLESLARESAIAHRQTAPSSTEWHETRLVADTVLAVITPDQMAPSGILRVNSLHHQSVANLAPGWIVSATAPDGIVEAIEKPGAAFALGVQWHPECLPTHGFLFEALIEAATQWRKIHPLDCVTL